MAASGNMLFYLFKRTWEYAGPVRPRLVLIYALYLTANIIMAFQPVTLAQIINTAQKGGPDAFRNALLWSAAYGAITFAFWSLHGPARVIERRTAFLIYRNFVTCLYRKVTEMPLRWHQDHHSGSTINRVNKAGRALFGFGSSQFVILQTAVRFSVSLCVLLWLSWWVALVSFLVSALIAYVIRRFDKVLIPLVIKNNERDHHLNAALYDYIGNIVTVLTLRLQRNTASEVDQRFDAMRPSFWRETRINEAKWGFVNLLLISTQAAIVGCYIGLHLMRGEALAIGAVVAIFQYLQMILQYFFTGMVTYEDIMHKQMDVHGTDQLLDDHRKLAIPPAAPARDWQTITVENLTFTHQEGEDKLHTLRNVSLAISAGRKIAFIGASGSGKTTLLTLMRGLYDAQQVRLTIDGAIFESLAPLSGFTTLIPQDSEIFENTVRYNLTLATDVADAVVAQALAITTFDAVAATLPEGIYTDIRERGVNLSGGQKQRLALARGLIAARGSSLLLLDEPTSSVDLPTEAHIFDHLFTAFADKAIIASIHRLHLLPRFDHICLMQNGMIVEQGSFADLLAKGGAFQGLWQQHLQSSVGEPEIE